MLVQQPFLSDPIMLFSTPLSDIICYEDLGYHSHIFVLYNRALSKKAANEELVMSADICTVSRSIFPTPLPHDIRVDLQTFLSERLPRHYPIES